MLEKITISYEGIGKFITTEKSQVATSILKKVCKKFSYTACTVVIKIFRDLVKHPYFGGNGRK
jgi:hypothetical protein